MTEHLRKHHIYQTPTPILSQQSTIDEMFQQPVTTLSPETLMSMEQAIIVWIIDILQPFEVVEKLLFGGYLSVFNINLSGLGMLFELVLWVSLVIVIQP